MLATAIGNDLKGKLSLLMYAAAIPAAFVNEWISDALYAAVALMWAKEFEPDAERYNGWGGAIAIGHPLGASGARIMTTMVNALEQRGGRYALQTMCEGGGMANATIIERL